MCHERQVHNTSILHKDISVCVQKTFHNNVKIQIIYNLFVGKIITDKIICSSQQANKEH